VKSDTPKYNICLKIPLTNKNGILLKPLGDIDQTVAVPGKARKRRPCAGLNPCLLTLLVPLLFSCSRASLSDARAQYLRGEYYAASRTYQVLYRDTPREQQALRGVISYEMAENYRRLNQSTRALTAYGNAIRFGYPDTVMVFHYAQMLHREGEYTQAADAYRYFLTLKPGYPPALNALRGIELSLLWHDKPSRYEVRRMELFHSGQSEFSPMLAQDDELLYFTSSGKEATGESTSAVTGMKYNDLFLSSKNSRGEWQKPKRIESEINTEFDEGTPSLTPDGEKMFYTYSSMDPAHPTTTGIYFSRRINAAWRAGQPLRIAGGDSLSVFAHPSVSSSGLYLCFVSDMPGGYGGKDIWRGLISHTGEVVSVENFGPEINTGGDELFPCMLNDTTLCFSSDGHPGMGGLDLFLATKQADADRWQVVNLQPPLNSAGDDFGITFEKGEKRGFFSSNRNDARGYDHIYSFEYKDVTMTVEGFAVDQDDRFIPGAVVSVVGSDGSRHRLVTDQQGVYRFTGKRGVDYLLMASANGFLNQRQSLRTGNTEKDTVYIVDFEMIPYDVPVVLQNIFYDFDRATLRPESKDGLNRLITLLNEHPEISIELTAHTDRRGTDDYNRDLSLRRAQSVVDYLAANGIDPKRLSTAGYGKTHPFTVGKETAASHAFLKEGDILTEEFIGQLTPEQQVIADQINRRTEFRVPVPAFSRP